MGFSQEGVKYQISLEDYFSRGIRDAESNAMRFESRIDSVGDHISRLKNQLAGAFAGYKLFQLGGDVIDTATRFENLNNVINYTSGSAAEAARNHVYLNEIISKYKLPLEETTEGYSQFSASVLGSSIQGEKARKVYEGVAIAATALHLSAQQNSSVFLALNQMMSKGKVQAQELTLQLGQALPGAMRIAANAMGYTTAKFMKEMEAGRIASADFLPKFADELSKRFSAAIPNAIKSIQAHRNEMRNAFITGKLSFGDVFHDEIIQGMDTVKNFALNLKDVATWLKENINLIKGLAAGLIVGYGAYKVMSAGVLVYNSFLIAQKLATEGLTFAQWAMNTAMAASPVGLIAIGLGAAAAAVYSYKASIDDFNAAIQKQTVSQEESKQSIENELTYLKQKTEELQKQKKLTEEVAFGQAVSSTRSKLMADYYDAKKKHEASWFNEDMKTYGEQGKRLNLIAGQLKKLDDAGLLKAVKSASGSTTGPGGVPDLGSGISEPKASRIQNITIKMGDVFPNMKNTYATMEMGADDFISKLAQALNGVVADVSLIAHE